jgi:hypothetical protein
LSQQREKFLYGQSRKFLLKAGTLRGGQETGAAIVDAEATGLAEGVA